VNLGPNLQLWCSWRHRWTG